MRLISCNRYDDPTVHGQDWRFTSRTRCGIQNSLISWMTSGMSWCAERKNASVSAPYRGGPSMDRLSGSARCSSIGNSKPCSMRFQITQRLPGLEAQLHCGEEAHAPWMWQHRAVICFSKIGACCLGAIVNSSLIVLKRAANERIAVNAAEQFAWPPADVLRKFPLLASETAHFVTPPFALRR